MQIEPALNHINIFTHNMDRLIRFYGDVLGFKIGYRPPFSVQGSWLYLQGNPLIHLVKTDKPALNIDPAVNHFALTGKGLAEFLELLRSHNVTYNIRIVPEIETHQVVVSDPDGNMFEVLFEGKEAKGVNIEAYNG